MYKPHPNRMAMDWILIILGIEKDPIIMRILLTILLPTIPVFWVGWWIGLLIAEVIPNA